MVSTASSKQITLPPQAEQAISSRVIKQPDPPRGLVLVVEDETELAELLEFNLLRNGFEVKVAHDGLDACRQIGVERPDLILLDLLLPLLDGWEICRMIRNHENPQIAEIPIVMLSALGSSDDRIKGYTLGADLYLPKPYVIKEVILKTGQLIERNRRLQQLGRERDLVSSHQRLQDEWQHALFHELRNQITIISGMAEFVSEHSVNLGEAQSTAYLKHIKCSANYLELIAENYLLVRQVEEDPAQLASGVVPLPLSQVFNDLNGLFQAMAREKEIALSFHAPQSPIYLETHPVALMIILSSLIDNAVKYTPQAGRVAVEVAIDQTKQLQIRVRDDGPGISADLKEKIFDKFSRGTVETVSGSGLGLYMARTFARALNGDLQCEDEEEGGCFVLTFPLPG